MSPDLPDADAWFAARGLRLEVLEVDTTGMERIRTGGPDEEPPRYMLTLIGKNGHLNRPNYSAADSLADAKAMAQDRYQMELAQPPQAALRWSQPELTMTQGDGTWTPFLEIHNLLDEESTVSGPMVATARLTRSDGTAVTSRQRGWPMPAVLRGHRLPPHGSTRIDVSLSLLTDEKAALPAGRYRLTDVWYGELQGPDIAVSIVAP